MGRHLLLASGNAVSGRSSWSFYPGTSDLVLTVVFLLAVIWSYAEQTSCLAITTWDKPGLIHIQGVSYNYSVTVPCMTLSACQQTKVMSVHWGSV